MNKFCQRLFFFFFDLGVWEGGVESMRKCLLHIHIPFQNNGDHWIGGVMVSVLTSSESYIRVWIEPKTAKFLVASSPLSTKHTASRSKSKDWLALNQDNVSRCLTAVCWFIELAILISNYTFYSSTSCHHHHHHHFIEYNLFSPYIANKYLIWS